jgi:hypothetical protein
MSEPSTDEDPSHDIEKEPNHDDEKEPNRDLEKEPNHDIEKEPNRDVEKDVQAASKEPEYPPLSKVIIVISALYLAVFLVALDQTIIGVAIPKITDQFKSIADIAWYGSAYFLTSTALQPSYGRIYKIFSVSQSPYLQVNFE